MSKRKISTENKIYAVNLYPWIRNDKSMSTDAFTLKRNKKYSKELKQQAVLDYLAG
mgnify:CR=1 FL=1